MKLQFPHCTYETISDFNLLCYKWRFAVAEFTVKVESGNSVITLPECFPISCTQIFSDGSLFCLQTAKSIVFWRGNLSPLLPENMSNAHMDSAAAQPRSSKQKKTAGRPGGIVQTSASIATRFALLQGYVMIWILSLCVSVTPCLGEIPLANTPTQTAHTVGLTAVGIGEATRLGEKNWRLGGSWLWIPYTAATMTELHVGFCNF